MKWNRLAAALFGIATCVHSSAPPPVAARPGLALYDGDVAIDPATSGVRAEWRITYVRDSALADTARLRLNRGFSVSRVSGPAVVAHSTLLDGDEQVITVVLAPAARGTATVLEIAYAGALVAPGDGINRVTPDWIELGLDSFWQPVFAGFGQTIAGQVRLTLSAGFRLAASGAVRQVDARTFVIESQLPLIDVPFSASPSLTSEMQGETRVFYTGARPVLVEPLLRTTESCASYLNELYGSVTPLPPRTMLLAPRTGPGYARKNYIVITGTDTTRAALARFVCHELAHFWSSRANSSGPENWLNEGFAEFVSAQYLRSRIGAAAYDTIVTQWRTVGERQPAVWTPESTRRPNAMISYRKAPYLLTQLEVRIGSAPMQRVLQRYMTEPIRTTPELIAMIGAVTDSATADWFRDLLSR